MEYEYLISYAHDSGFGNAYVYYLDNRDEVYKRVR